MAFFTVNWPGILIAAAAAWLFAAVYYTALSAPWIAALGKTREQCQREMAAKSAAAKAAPFILAFIGNVVIAWTLYGLLIHLNAFSLRGGVISGALCWFGFVLTSMAVNNVFVGNRAMLTVIGGGGWLGTLVIIGAIVGWFGP